MNAVRLFTWTWSLLLVSVLVFGQAEEEQNNNEADTSNTNTVENAPTEITDSLKTFLGETVANLINEATRIEAYHFEEWAVDESSEGFHGFKVIERKESINESEAQELKEILCNDGTYVIDDIAKRCEFGPNIGFRFTKKQESFTLLIALNCDVLQFIHGENQTVIEDCDPAHDTLVALGNKIFPNAFNAYVNNN